MEFGVYKCWLLDYKLVFYDVFEIVVYKDFDLKILFVNIVLVYLVRFVIISEDVRLICLLSRLEIEYFFKFGMFSDGIVVGWGKIFDY